MAGPDAAAAARWAQEQPTPAERAAVGGRPGKAAAPEIPDALREHLAALEHYRLAVQKLAEIDAKIGQYQRARDAFAAKVREAQGVMRETDPTRRRATAGRTGAATVREQVLAALPGTTRELAERSGLTGVQVSSVLRNLHEQRLVEREGTRGSYIWRRAEA